LILNPECLHIFLMSVSLIMILGFSMDLVYLESQGHNLTIENYEEKVTDSVVDSMKALIDDRLSNFFSSSVFSFDMNGTAYFFLLSTTRQVA
jgi:hypothetical protein